MQQYQALYDDTKQFVGVYDMILDFKPMLQHYLEENRAGHCWVVRCHIWTFSFGSFLRKIREKDLKPGYKTARL
ncbi:hypothetical protein [Streptococcus equi]|uniref:hypothetical protein n=1 Tax=Streptococcus equi TaxID=1336 RepID=UPI001E2B8C42|nr:hypothetical protein [Streptococcus equi]